MNCHYATAALTLSSESWALSCCADLPGDQTLYAVSVYMKYSAKQRRISSFAKIVNFVRQARAKDQICLMAVYIKELKINTPLGRAFSTQSFCCGQILGKVQIGLMVVRND